MLDKFFRLFSVLKEGESLLHSATWKNRQVTLNAVSVILVFGVSFVPSLNLSAEDIQTLASAVAVIGGVINGYLTVATSDKIGVVKSDTPSLPGSTPPGDLQAFYSP